MKAPFKFLAAALAVFVTAIALCSFFAGPRLATKQLAFPYKQAGLTERQAAAHLLNRFTYGAKPGQVDEVVKMGLENWFSQQLAANNADDSLKQMLSKYDAINLTNAQVEAEYPRANVVLRLAVKDGVIKRDSNFKADKKEYRDQLQAYMQQKGLKPQQELYRQFINQKILRAAYSNNQLQEVLTSFWFNHFNVSVTKNDCAPFIPAYERDVIRPNVLGKFDNLLLATAKSPAMLYYLDNFQSSAPNSGKQNNNAFNARLLQNQQTMMMGDSTSQRAKFVKQAQQAKKNQGLNENYAREVMELHTLGVDGGYTQSDVTQAARVLTGWGIYPLDDKGGLGSVGKKIIGVYGENNLTKVGFVHEGDFLFNMNRHDKGEKTVLAHHFDANGGYQEGVELLEMLAHHPSAAKFITKKIAVRFVSDNPSPSLLAKMSKSFTEHDGDIKEVLITMVNSPEFWSKTALREKTKSPFELAISSVRGLNATVNQPFLLNAWITKMGEKMYFYQAPTGYPDKGQYWINTGALLNRMNFGLALASQRIPGVKFDLAALNNHHEPESSEAALKIYGKIMMPERNLDQTIARLTPMLNDPNLVKKIDEAAGKTTAPADMNSMNSDDMMMSDKSQGKALKAKTNKGLKGNDKLEYAMTALPGNNSMLSQVVGILIGSPEYQRR
jgi:uncharacterized protein (DUF1800 family)